MRDAMAALRYLDEVVPGAGGIALRYGVGPRPGVIA
jgi:hypothetical protein